MTVELLAEELLCPSSTVGPYRHQDYDRLPDEPRCELVYGRFYLTPSPTVTHQMVAMLLCQRLLRIARETGGLAVIAPIDTTLADHTVVQPDVIYLSAKRRPLAQERITGAPDLVVEVLSPGTARRDRGEKLKAYAEFGATEYWLVDSAARQIEFLSNRAGRFEVVLPIDGVYASETIPGVRLDLVDFWSEVAEWAPRSAPPLDPSTSK